MQTTNNYTMVKIYRGSRSMTSSAPTKKKLKRKGTVKGAVKNVVARGENRKANKVSLAAAMKARATAKKTTPKKPNTKMIIAKAMKDVQTKKVQDKLKKIKAVMKRIKGNVGTTSKNIKKGSTLKK